MDESEDTSTPTTLSRDEGNAVTERNVAPVEGPESPYVFSLGQVSPVFPQLSIEREFHQAIRDVDSVDKTDHEVRYEVLSDPQNRYLARNMCWLYRVRGVETYLLHARDAHDLDQLISCIRPRPQDGDDIDIVVGTMGPLSPPERCNGIVLPIVVPDNIFPLDLDSLVDAVPVPDDVEDEDGFRSVVKELYDRISQVADNAGNSDEHRAMNYLAVRYPAIYALAADMYGEDTSLRSVTVRNSRLSGARKILDVIFAYVDRSTDVQSKFFVRVDVSEMYPFLVSKMAPYFDR